MNADALLERASRRHPDRLCWQDQSGGLTFHDANELVGRMAGGLERLGVGAEDRVALIGPDSVTLLAAIAACWRTASLPCLLDPRLPPDEAADLLERISPRLLLQAVEAPWDGPAASLDEAPWGGEALPESRHRDSSPLFCSTTSGTTGRPKLAVLVSGPVTLATSCIADRAGLERDDVMVATTPTASSFQLVSAVLPALHVAAGLVLAAGRGPDGVNDAVEAGGTVLVAYPLILGAVAAEPPRDGLRLAISGGSPLPPRLKREYRDRLGFPLIESYGMSELGGFVALGRPDEQGAPLEGAVGRPLPDRPVTVVDPSGREVDEGELGEVAVGEGFMAGYLDDPEAGVQATRGGILHTGDVGSFDEGGYLRVEGRLGETDLASRLGGFPRLCEDALHDHPPVLHAGAIPCEDGLAAFVQARPGAEVDSRDVIAHVAKRVPRELVPRTVTVLETMPQTFSGKLDRRRLATIGEPA